MPIVDPSTGNPYSTITDVMNSARARVNDMMNSAEGDLLADDVPASQTYLTDAWDWLQARCDVAGVQTFKKTVVLFGIPMRLTNDVANEGWITWAGVSDGQNQFEAPTLPGDLISPKSLWRRRNMGYDDFGVRVENQNGFELMTQATDGLPPFIETNFYEWREDGIYFYPERYAQDFRMSYSAYRPPLDITQPNTQVPLMFCKDTMGWRVAYEFANARGAAQAPDILNNAENSFNTIMVRANRIKGRQSIRRQGYTTGNCNGQGWTPQILPNN